MQVFPSSRSFWRGAVLVALVSVIVCLQVSFDRTKPLQKGGLIETLPTRAYDTFDFGMRSATGSALWLALIQDIGSGRLSSFDGFTQRIDAITTLDPRFGYPYAFAALLVPELEPAKTQDMIAIGQRGIDAGVSDWRIPYYIAITYHVALKDPVNAARYFAIAAQTPGIPDGIRKTSLKYGSEKDPLEQAKQLWLSLYETSDDETVRDRAWNNYGHYQILEDLTAAIARYKKMEGKPPASIDDLVMAKLIPGTPNDQLGITYSIGPDGELVLNTARSQTQ